MADIGEEVLSLTLEEGEVGAVSALGGTLSVTNTLTIAKGGRFPQGAYGTHQPESHMTEDGLGLTHAHYHRAEGDTVSEAQKNLNVLLSCSFKL